MTGGEDGEELHDDAPGGEPVDDADDIPETRSMQAEILMGGAEGGLLGVALGAVTAAGATIWLTLRGRGKGHRR